MPEWLRIGEVSRLTGLTHRTLRHYDDLGLLVPSGRSYSDYRLYSAADMERLLAIQHLKSLGLSLDEVRQVLDEPGTDAADLIDRHIAAVEETLAQEGERRARLQRLRAAAQIGWDDVLDVLSLGQQLQHADPNVRFRAALTEQGSAAVEDLVERLRSDPEPEVREAATWALVHRGAVVMNAIDSLRDGDERARHSLAHLLGKLRDPAGVATLADLAGDASEAVAVKAVFGLGQVGGDTAARRLVEALHDERRAVRDEATASLSRLPEARWLLRDAAASPSAVVRLHAVEALADHTDPADLQVLAAALQDADAEVRYAALLSLGQRPEPGTVSAIEAAASSGDDRTRAVARRLLSDRGAASPDHQG